MNRQAYRKDTDDDGMCICGEGRAQPVHAVLAFKKAPSGNYVAGKTNGSRTYRCALMPGGRGWLPQVDMSGETSTDFEWEVLDPNTMTLAQAKIVCEEHRAAGEGDTHGYDHSRPEVASGQG